MPYYTSSAFSSFDVTHSLHHLFYCKKLLITSHFLYTVIIERKTVHQSQQSLWTTKVVDISILHRRRQWRFVLLLYIRPHITISLAEHLGIDALLVHLLGQLIAIQLLGIFVGKLLGPLAPKLFWRGGCCITHLIYICRQQ